MGYCLSIRTHFSSLYNGISLDVGWSICLIGGTLDFGSASGRTGVEAFDSLDEKGEIFHEKRIYEKWIRFEFECQKPYRITKKNTFLSSWVKHGKIGWQGRDITKTCKDM